MTIFEKTLNICRFTGSADKDTGNQVIELIKYLVWFLMEVIELYIQLLLEMDELGFHITHRELHIIVLILMLFSHFDVEMKILLRLAHIYVKSQIIWCNPHQQEFRQWHIISQYKNPNLMHNIVSVICTLISAFLDW